MFEYAWLIMRCKAHLKEYEKIFDNMKTEISKKNTPIYSTDLFNHTLKMDVLLRIQLVFHQEVMLILYKEDPL